MGHHSSFWHRTWHLFASCIQQDARLLLARFGLVPVLSSMYPSLISFSSHTFPGASYRIILQFLPWLPCHFHPVVFKQQDRDPLMFDNGELVSNGCTPGCCQNFHTGTCGYLVSARSTVETFWIRLTFSKRGKK